MSNSRLNKRNKAISKVKPLKSSITKKDKTIWIIILIGTIILFCLMLLLELLNYFIVI